MGSNRVAKKQKVSNKTTALGPETMLRNSSTKPEAQVFFCTLKKGTWEVKYL